jgi:hypothetical protein
MTYFPQSLHVAVQSFGVAPAVIIAFLWGVVIFGLLETLRQQLKLKRTEQEWRQWRRASEQYDIRQSSAPSASQRSH